MAENEKCILIFSAHNDDQIIGVGGTIRKYVNEGKKAYTYIFSYGEQSHPHLRPEIVAKMREKESLQGAKILGDEIEYFGLNEGNFEKEVDFKLIEKIIKEKKPEKIFTHSPDDPHPDHKAVLRIMIKVLKGIDYKGDVYSFDIWNLFTFKTRCYPKLFIDISDTYKIKSKSFRAHKSQWSSIALLGWSMFLKALWNGWNNDCRYAEVFHKLNLDDVSIEEKVQRK
ncbi:PIG-L family deacetylase [Candidatus Woesearchaeota archaeon]|nr:PIG-L family deacetylase [Candidatus Woesearchaeota archaeon]